MANTNVTITMDKNLKADVERLFDELGLSMSGAISLFARQALRTGGLPFEVKLSPEQILYQKLEAGQAQIDNGEGLSWNDFKQQVKDRYGV